MEPDTTQSANRQIARAAGTVMAAFVLSNLIGLIRGILIMRGFGTGAEMEAFNTANRLAETLFNLVAGGALASAFVPTFTGFLARKDQAGAWRLASGIANLVIIILTIVSAVSALFAPQIVRYLLAPGFADEPAKFNLTVQLLQIILPSVVIFGLSGLIMGILNANQIFLFPALAPSMYSAGIIFGVLVLSPHMGIFGLAWGTILGAALHLLVQVPSLLRLKFAYKPILGLENPAVREVGRLMLPRLFGAGIVQLNFWVNTNLASRQPEGSLTSITTAFTLMMMPQALIAQTIAIASLPTFSAQVALGKLDEMRSSLASTIRAVLLLA
ncbi:MAG TPA: murein biosynthesis integral membrane protein MurJ, partial [Leptolinea sp.]